MTTHARASMRDVLSEAIQYWEPRRIVYNLALAAVVAVPAAVYWAQIRDRISFELLLALLVLAVLANVCYCTAYIVDIPMQLSEHGARWRRWRWMLWLFGVLFGAALAWFWAGDEIIPALLKGK
jgi:succinate dehydrogenase/fumarate reductase cytochrome b subunit